MKDYRNYIVKNIIENKIYKCETQKDVARLLHCDPSTVSVYVRNGRLYKKTWEIKKDGTPKKIWC